MCWTTRRLSLRRRPGRELAWGTMLPVGNSKRTDVSSHGNSVGKSRTHHHNHLFLSSYSCCIGTPFILLNRVLDGHWTFYFGISSVGRGYHYVYGSRTSSKQRESGLIFSPATRVSLEYGHIGPHLSRHLHPQHAGRCRLLFSVPSPDSCRNPTSFSMSEMNESSALNEEVMA